MTFKTYLLLEDLESKLPILLVQYGAAPAIVSFLKTRHPEAYLQMMRKQLHSPVPGSASPWHNEMIRLFRDIAARTDPTMPKAKYITWILQMIKNKSVRMYEDFDKVKERLSEFDRLKKTPDFNGQYRDINQYGTYGQLAATIDANKGLKSKGELVRSSEMSGISKISEIVVTSGDIKKYPVEPAELGYGMFEVGASEIFKFNLYLVNTPEAASKLFRETDWCIKDPKWFNQYKDKNFYYITGISKGPRHTSKVPDIELPLYLANFGTKQLKDKNDNAIDEYGQQEYTTIGKYDVYTNPKVVHLLLDFFRPLPAYQAFKKDCIKRNTKSLAGGHYVPAEVEEWCEATFKKILWTEDIGDLLGPGAQVGVPLLKKVDKRQIGILIESIFSMMEDWASDKEFLEPPNEFYALLIKDGADALPEEVRSGVDYDARIIWIENKRKDQAWLKVKAKEIADWASENLYWTYSS